MRLTPSTARLFRLAAHIAPAPEACRAIQQNDEMHCAICGLRWDVNDGDPPKCRRANFGDLDFLAPNHFDPAKRGFQPK